MSLRYDGKFQNYIISAFFIIIFCIPLEALTDSMALSLTIVRIIYLIRYAGFFWALVIFFLLKVYNEKKLYSLWLFLFIMFISTLANGNSLKALFQNYYMVFACVVLSQHMLYLYGRKGAKAIIFVFSALMYIQAFSALVGGFGYTYGSTGIQYPSYFFGLRVNINHILMYAVTLAVLLAVNESLKYTIMAVLTFAASVFFAIYESVSTAIMGLSLFVLMLILTKVLKSKRLWRNLFIFIFILVIVFVVLGNTDGFSWLLEDLLQEDMTLDGRTIIWEQALSNISGWHWILGNGYGHNFTFWLGDWNATTAHSQYINIIFSFGIVGLLSYFYLCYKEISVIKNDISAKHKDVIIAACISIMIGVIPSSTYLHVYMYIFYVLLMNWEWLSENEICSDDENVSYGSDD